MCCSLYLCLYSDLTQRWSLTRREYQHLFNTPPSTPVQYGTADAFRTNFGWGGGSYQQHNSRNSYCFLFYSSKAKLLVFVGKLCLLYHIVRRLLKPFVSASYCRTLASSKNCGYNVMIS